MSVSALTWAFASQIRPATAKFVLVALADYANEVGEAYPSIETLCRKTCMDRKTIISHLQFLADIGAIADTGERRGRTKKVKVYALAGFLSEVNSTENGMVPFFPGNSPKNGTQNR